MIECRYCDTLLNGVWDYKEHIDEHEEPFTTFAGRSHKCYCDYCGDTFERVAASITVNQYCSPECHNVDRIDPDQKYVQKQKELAKERDNWTCQGCGDHKDELQHTVHAHHIIPERDFDDVRKAAALGNLITLCPTCHNRWEGLYLRPDNR